MDNKTEKTGETKNNKENSENIFNIWIGNYIAISKIWEESYIKLYRPWLESTSILFEKAIEVSGTNSPEKYREFYDEWEKTFQGKLQKSVKIPDLETNKRALEKLLKNAERSSEMSKLWTSEIEENSKKTREILEGDPDPIKYKEIYDLWIKSYAKIFDDLLTLPFREDIRDMFENYTGVPDTYSDTFVKISRLYNDSYIKLYGTWTDALVDLSKKSEDISRGNIGPDAYKEFYSCWINLYQQTYGKFLDIQLVQKRKDGTDGTEQLNAVFQNFIQSTTNCANLYKSWINMLNKLSEKSAELSRNMYKTPDKFNTSDGDIYNEICALWIRIYQKAFDNIMDNVPMVTPFKDIFSRPMSIQSTEKLGQI